MRESARQCAERLSAFQADKASEVATLADEIDRQKETIAKRKRTIDNLSATVAQRDASLDAKQAALAEETRLLRQCRDEHARLRQRYDRVLTRLGPLDFSLANETRLVPILGRKRLDIVIGEVDVCDPGRAEIVFVYE